MLETKSKMRILFIFLILFSVAAKAQLFKNHATPAGTQCLVYDPDSTKRLPLMIHLHGIGERGTGNNLTTILKNGTPQFIRDTNFRPEFVLVCPQLPITYGSWPASFIDEVLEDAKRSYNVDTTQIWLVGLSLGGGGVWAYVQNPNYIKKLAAFVPICGSSNDPSKAINIVREGIPGWAFHSTNDGTVPYSRTTNMRNAINISAKKEQVKLTEYVNGHSAWVKACDPTQSELYTWLFWQKRPFDEVVIKYEIVIVNGALKLKMSTATRSYYITID